MRHSDYRTLLSRGRKAGLTTAELYSAMVTRFPECSERAEGRADANGFVAEFDRFGQRIYRPLRSGPRS